MWDARIAELAGHQFNRVARWQLTGMGMGKAAIQRRVEAGRLVIVEQGVLAVAPVLDHDEWGRWMGATLTAPETWLSHESATTAYGLWAPRREFETVTRAGSGGPRLHGGVLVHRSSVLSGDRAILRGVPITSVPRTLLDIAAHASQRWISRLVRDAVREDMTTLAEIADVLGRHIGRRGSRRLAIAVARYSGLPIERARSGAEVRALEVLRAAGRPLPKLNVVIAGEEADLSWPTERLIVEIDGGPFHLDVGEDTRKEITWRSAGWTVRRLPSDDVYERPGNLLAIAPSSG